MPEGKNELKKCPFCGGDAVIDNAGQLVHVYCKECGAKVTSVLPGAVGIKAAEDKWNRRCAV